MLKLIFGTKTPKTKKVVKPTKRNVYAANYGSKPFPNAYSHL